MGDDVSAEGEIDRLVEAFRSNRLAAAALHREGRTAAGNRRADASHAAFTALVRTQQGQDALRALLEDPEREVQLDVAGRLLPAPEAEAALERWARMDDVRGRQAAFTLKFFRLAAEDDGAPSAGDRDGAATRAVEPMAARADRAPATDAEETVVSFHGLVMNGGVSHAVGVSEAAGTPVAEVLTALRSCGLDDLAHLVEAVRENEDADDDLTDRWSDLIPTDEQLERRIEATGEAG